MKITYRWLGAAGVELSCGDQTLLIDPFFTRPSLAKMLTNSRVQPDAALVKTYLQRADWILVSHSHYDHLLDVPNIMRQFGAAAVGSANTCQILRLSGLPEHQIRLIQAGSELEFGPFHIHVLPSWHIRTPIDFMIKGPLARNLRLPLRLADYKMDVDFSFLIQVGSWRILVGNEPVGPVDMVFTMPFCPPDRLAALLKRACPPLVCPIHWENFNRPLTQPLTPTPFRRNPLLSFHGRVQELSPISQVLLPVILEEYQLPPAPA